MNVLPPISAFVPVNNLLAPQALWVITHVNYGSAQSCSFGKWLIDGVHVGSSALSTRIEVFKSCSSTTPWRIQPAKDPFELVLYHLLSLFQYQMPAMDLVKRIVAMASTRRRSKVSRSGEGASVLAILVSQD